MAKIALRCKNTTFHVRHRPPIALLFDGSSVYVKCKDKGCGWIKIEISIPGVKIDFGKASFTQTVIPKDVKFELIESDCQ